MARGLVAYDAADAVRIAGLKSADIEKTLGFRGRDVIIHRDDLVDDRRGQGMTAACWKWDRRRAQAARMLALAPAEQKNAALKAMAAAIRARSNEILAANAEDVKAAEAKAASRPPSSIGCCSLIPVSKRWPPGIEEIAALPDPVGKVTETWQRPNGLKFSRIRVPIGVIGIIFESRPNVTADAGALAMKSGNAAILRGGSDGFAHLHADLRMPAGRIAAGGPACLYNPDGADD